MPHMKYAMIAPCAFAATFHFVHAQDYLVKPIRLIVPQPPGGTSDIIGRALAARLGDQMRQQVIVDNRVGASGTIGTDIVAKAAPDGYTLVLIYTTHTTSPSLYAKLPYDPINDFSPITLVSSAPLLLAFHPQLPAKDVAGLVSLAKARPGQLNFPSAGNGSGGHLAGELFKVMARVDVTHVPYRGTGPAVIDLISGQMQFMFAGIVPVDPHVKSGRLRGVAVTSLKRSRAVPQFPAVAESLPGFEIVGWVGLLAPAKTPRVIVSKLHAETLSALQSRDVGDRLKSEGTEIVGSTPAVFGEFLKADLQRWAQVIKRAGAKID